MICNIFKHRIYYKITQQYDWRLNQSSTAKPTKQQVGAIRPTYIYTVRPVMGSGRSGTSFYDHLITYQDCPGLHASIV